MSNLVVMALSRNLCIRAFWSFALVCFLSAPSELRAEVELSKSCRELIELSRVPSSARVTCPKNPALTKRAKQAFQNCLAGEAVSETKLDILFELYGGEIVFQACIGNAIAKERGLM